MKDEEKAEKPVASEPESISPFDSAITAAIDAIPEGEKLHDQLVELRDAAFVEDVDPVREYFWRRALQLIGNQCAEARERGTELPEWLVAVRFGPFNEAAFQALGVKASEEPT